MINSLATYFFIAISHDVKQAGLSRLQPALASWFIAKQPGCASSAGDQQGKQLPEVLSRKSNSSFQSHLATLAISAPSSKNSVSAF